MNIFEYTYYQVYEWNLRKWGAKDVPEYKAMYILALLMFLNVCTIGLFLDKIGVIKFLSWPKFSIILVLVGFCLIAFYNFVYNGKFKTIEKKYKGESLSERKNHTFMMWAYIFLSFIVNILIVVL
jgi:hypothetical protein